MYDSLSLVAVIAIVCYALFYVSTSLSEIAQRKEHKILSAVLSAIGYIFIVLFAVSAFIVAICFLLVLLYAFMSYAVTGGIFGITIFVGVLP